MSQNMQLHLRHKLTASMEREQIFDNIQFEKVSYSMESKQVSIEVMDHENLQATHLITIGNFLTIVNTSEETVKLQHEFQINDTYKGRFIFYPLGANGAKTNISMALEIDSPNSYEYYGDVNMSIVGSDGKHYFLTKSLWAVYEGPAIQELLDAKYLIGGMLRIQIDIRLNYEYIERPNLRHYRGCLRKVLRHRIYGNMVVRVQDHFDFYVDHYMMRQYYSEYNLIPLGEEDSRNRPIHALPGIDPYVFQWSLVNTYMYDARMAGASAG